jgi:hypothetical protein
MLRALRNRSQEAGTIRDLHSHHWPLWAMGQVAPNGFATVQEETDKFGLPEAFQDVSYVERKVSEPDTVVALNWLRR